MKLYAFLLGLLLPAFAHGQEIVTLSTRPGATQSFFIAAWILHRPFPKEID